MYEPRLTRPEKGNKYYIRRADGGYNTAILGKPTDKDCNVLANCVGYAVGRFHEISKRLEFDLISPVNAEDIFSNAKAHGLRTGTIPALGAIAVWSKGKTGNGSDGAGHVAIVEKICNDSSIVTSESGYNAKAPFWTTHRYRGNGNWGQSADYKFLGFVYQPHDNENPYPIPSKTVKKNDMGAAVKWLQWELVNHGYMRESEIDGYFGVITLGALLAFQFENNLEVDGVCGPDTKGKMR